MLSGSPDAGIWSDGTTLWALDTSGTLRAYKLSDGEEIAVNLSYGEEITEWSVDLTPDGYYDTREVNEPRGIWSDGDTLWVTGKDNEDNAKAFAFALPKGCNYCRKSNLDFELSDDNDNPWGITGNDYTWWVTEVGERGMTTDARKIRNIYAYNRSDRTRDADKDIDLSQLNISNIQQLYYGLAATDTIMYVAEYITGRVYSFNMPGVSGPVAPALVSSDATLSDLSLKVHPVDPVDPTIVPLNPPFPDSGNTVYSAQAEPEVESILVVAEPNDISATVKINGTIAPKVDGTNARSSVVSLGAEGTDTTITVHVKAPDDRTTKEYTVVVHRRAKSTDATLDSLVLSAVPFEESGVPFTFQSDTYSYTPDAVANSVAETTVTATPNSEHTKLVVIKHNGNEVGRNNEGRQVTAVIALDAQEVDDPVVNTITVEVTAEDDSKQIYTVTVTRERALSNVATMRDLVLMYADETIKLREGACDDEVTDSYDADVAYGVESLIVKFSPCDEKRQDVSVFITDDDVTITEKVDPTNVTLAEGVNTLTVKVTAEDGTVKSYVVNIERAAPSNDATLASLLLDPGTLDRKFYRELFSMDATVGHDDATTKLSIVRSDGDKADVVVRHGGAVERHADMDDTVEGGIELTAFTDSLIPDALNYTIPLAAPVGTLASETVVTIEVTAEDNTYKVYEVEITRPVEPDSDDVTLRTLTLTNPKNDLAVPLVSVSDTYFTADVGNDAIQVVVVAIPTNSDADSVQLLVDGTNLPVNKADLAGGVTVDLAEPDVAKVLSIKVTAENGTDTGTYNIAVTRDFPPPRGVTALDSLVLKDVTKTPVTLDPLFATEETSYAASVDHGVTKLEVIAGPTDTSGAKVAVTVGGTVVDGAITGGTPAVGGFVPLDNVGSNVNVIRVVVTAENGTDTETYTVTVTRIDAPADNVATLSSLTVDGEEIGFMPDTYSYTVNVLNAVDSTTVRAVATSANASLTASPGSLSDLGPAAVSLDSDLVEGDNEITVVVTAENGIDTDKKTYAVTVNRAAPSPPPGSNNGGGTSNRPETSSTNTGGGPFTPIGGSNTGSNTEASDTETAQDESDTVTPLDDVGDADTDHQADINELHGLGVFVGTLCEANSLCPNDPMARWIAAVWLVRLIDGDDPEPITESRFADVNAATMWEESMWFAPHVERLAELEITVGCSEDPLNFCPDVMLRKAQVASWLARAFDLESDESQGFVDAVGSVYEANINAVVAAGVMEGCSTDPKNFCLVDGVTKGEMASYVNKARKAASN